MRRRRSSSGGALALAVLLGLAGCGRGDRAGRADHAAGRPPFAFTLWRAPHELVLDSAAQRPRAVAGRGTVAVRGAFSAPDACSWVMGWGSRGDSVLTVHVASAPPRLDPGAPPEWYGCTNAGVLYGYEAAFAGLAPGRYRVAVREGLPHVEGRGARPAAAALDTAVVVP